ncbi:2'-5' RNA ligase family protein [Alicyclobacillus ferrooxydans]|uniref:2'-5' RNA ligase n=1 Tax=Alicyclobacillus ferrooxydans TaxID=471514 RepID=A0A0P9ELU6_9BACL|nr:2'-5' RNA ligase family protein [Alicyclobacillus ferrooxydans]KPV44274.1 hypothetical protein AN477_08245 [Alicyclobacillus ferrooxydans]
MRAIHLFPKFPNVESVQSIRRKYDPLMNLIPPHVTLVFPFHSEIPTGKLVNHVKESLAGLAPFRFMARGITGSDGEYLFLNIKVGNDHIIQLHDRLYTGPLSEHLCRALTYSPHITVGRISDQAMFKDALIETETFHEVFETTANEVLIEMIDEIGMSTIEAKIPLGI